MGEIKSVKVDNWGVFFLQKLQNFFNKTDYCDLTLQFRDNSQLKVHRLVLSACTDYFNVLEQTCEVVDDALLMPDELQADVVVPIVNFMYTGTLEFELKMYGKLLRTAKEMNMTVLLKLLEAHRRTMEGVNRAQRPPSPKPIRRRVLATAGAASQQALPVQQQRRILATSNVSSQQGARVVQTKTIATNAPQQQMQFRQQIGSTSLLRTSASGSSPVKAQYGTTIYNRQQFKQEVEDYESSPTKQQLPSSPFEQLRKGYNNNKRPTTTTFVSPPAKKPNIEDVKEFAEQQRMRKQIAAEYGEDPEYEGMLDDDIHNDDDDDDTAIATSSSTAAVAVQATTSSSVVGTSSSRVVQHGTTTITFKQEQNDKPPTIVVKDSSNSNINHTKIITEVLRQYPHLVKNNKNIKLKIMPNVGGQTQKIVVKREVNESTLLDETGSKPRQQQHQVTIAKSSSSSQTLLKPDVSQLQSQQQSQTAKFPAQKLGASAATAVATATASTGTTQKRRIDSKTMHALIALGAENTTGPWLCLRCGVNGRPISIPSYRGFRRHLINTHKETIDPALCEHCGWRSSTNRDLHFHIQVEHKVKTTLYTFPECLMCTEMFLDTNALNQHMVDSHPDENKQQCIYCNKIFAKELQLYNHMKTYHKKQALADGIIDYSDEEFAGSQDEAELETKKDTKIKILSDISLPNASSLLKLEPSSEAAALSTVASGIAASIGVASVEEEFMQISGSETAGVETKFVNADGNEMLLTDEQRKEIMSQLNQEHEGGGGVVMLLNESAFTPVPVAEANSDAGGTNDGEEETKDTPSDEKESDGQLEQETDHAAGETSPVAEEFEDSQIYNELTSRAEEKKANASTTLEENKESIDNLEWAENLISAHELADDSVDSNKTSTTATVALTHEDNIKKEDDISKKLKELTGDWSDDENDDDDLNEACVDSVSTTTETITTAASTEVKDVMPEKIEETEQKPEAKDPEIKEETPEKRTEDIQEAKYDEDDIDVAMRSLHKEEVDMEDNKDKVDVDDDISEVIKAEKSTVPVEQIAKLESEEKSRKQNTNKKDEQINKNLVDGSHKEEIEKDPVDELKEEPAAATIEGNTSKSPLNVSISTEVVSEEPQEFNATQDSEAKIVKEPVPDTAEAKTSTENKLIETDEKVTDAGTAIDNIIVTDSIEKETNKDEAVICTTTLIDALETTVTETIIAVSELTAAVSEPTATVSEPTATVAEPTAAVSEPAAAASEKTATAPSTNTEDKVKSLISEWADDEDDDDPDNADEEEL